MHFISAQATTFKLLFLKEVTESVVSHAPLTAIHSSLVKVKAEHFQFLARSIWLQIKSLLELDTLPFPFQTSPGFHDLYVLRNQSYGSGLVTSPITQFHFLFSHMIKRSSPLHDCPLPQKNPCEEYRERKTSKTG